MSKALLFKLGMIALVTLLLIIVLEVVSGTVADRQHYKETAKSNIARSWTGQQELLGPVLRLPYTLEWQVEHWSNDGKEKLKKTRRQKQVMYLLPTELTQKTHVDTDIRKKGIFEIPVYEADIAFQGTFDFPLKIDTSHIVAGDVTVHYGQATLSLGIRDSRGISETGSLHWGKSQTEFAAGSQLNYLPNGLHASVEIDPDEKNRIMFATNLKLRGLDSLLIHPVADSFRLNMTSLWPHPSFVGNFLPRKREISQAGFSAEWQVSEFASNVKSLVGACAGTECQLSSNHAIGVEFVQPINIYVQTERSLKYAVLFIALVFAAFFVFEILKTQPIHPIQYGLVGLAIAIFYLLLISLSEHISFTISYLIAAFFCILLITFYLTYVLKSVLSAGGFATWLSLIYLLLFVIVSAEDFALLMGSSTLFVMLGVLMVATRNIDWYEIELDATRSGQPLDS